MTEKQATKENEKQPPRKKPKLQSEDQNLNKKPSNKAARHGTKSTNFNKKSHSVSSEPKDKQDWLAYKKEKKELKLKRIKSKTKENFDKIQQVKKMGEKLRLKILKEDERNKIINQMNSLLKGNYAKFVLAHDTARIVQWLLKYSSKILVNQISQELIPITINMLQSKYGIHCLKGMLKYGQKDIQSSVVDQLNGHAVKLACHSLSAHVLEHIYSTYANAAQKQLLIQEFYGDLYKNSKDANVKHLRDVYKDNENMKAGTLNACKANIKKVLNKSLLDSELVQTVLSQYLEECSAEDKSELITELIPHIVVVSNSKDGSKVAMECIWTGTNKDKKSIMKSLKEHLTALCKHEHGHRVVIALLDCVDDTVLLHKIILTEILKNAQELAADEWGRKVLLWLVAPADPLHFHPKFTKELEEKRTLSSSKKPAETRREEILNYSNTTLLNLIIENPTFWLSSVSLALEMVAILKAGAGNELEQAFRKIAAVITDSEWKIKDKNEEIRGIEHAGIHIALKKLIHHDKVASENGKLTFGTILEENLNNEIIESWLEINRSCFILVFVLENNPDNVRKALKTKLKPFKKVLGSKTSLGANILKKLCKS